MKGLVDTQIMTLAPAVLLLLPALLQPATLKDCIRAWRADGMQPPRIAYVVNFPVYVNVQGITVRRWWAECHPGGTRK
jgi:hypothetical protein